MPVPRSVIRTMSGVTPGMKNWFHCEMATVPPASSSRRLVCVDVHVACSSRFGSNRYPGLNSCMRVELVEPQLHARCSS